MYYSSGTMEAFARPRKPEGVENKTAWFVGAGLASMASAAFMIRDGQMDGSKITILERLKLPGGALDGIKEPKKGFVIRGGREVDDHYECLWDLYRSIPSIEVDGASVLDEFYWLNKDDPNSSLQRATVDRGQDAGTVPVRGLVAEAGADADEPGDVRHPLQRPRDGVGAGVVVEDRRHAVADALDERGARVQLHVLQGEQPVQAPPEVLEDLGEAPGRLVDRHPARVGAVGVGVGVDQASHDDPAADVQHLLAGMGGPDLGHRADRDDAVALHHDRPVVDEGVRRVVGDDGSVADDHNWAPRGATSMNE